MKPKALVQDDRVVAIYEHPSPWTHEDVQHPAGLMAIGSRRVLRTRGLYEFKPATLPDMALCAEAMLRYEIDHKRGIVQAVYDLTPVDCESAKEIVTGRIMDKARRLLQASDWRVIRAFEYSQLSPQAKKSNPHLASQAFSAKFYVARQKVRDESGARCAKVDAMETTEEVLAYRWDSRWPRIPERLDVEE